MTPAATTSSVRFVAEPLERRGDGDGATSQRRALGFELHGTLTRCDLDFESGTFGHSVSSPPRKLQGLEHFVKRC